MGYVIVAVVAVAVAVFAMQNTTPVTIQFLVWRLEQVSLAAVILASLAAGLVVAGIPLWFRVWRLRSRLRTSEARAARPGDAPEPPAPRPFPPA